MQIKQAATDVDRPKDQWVIQKTKDVPQIDNSVIKINKEPIINSKGQESQVSPYIPNSQDLGSGQPITPQSFCMALKVHLLICACVCVFVCFCIMCV